MPGKKIDKRPSASALTAPVETVSVPDGAFGVTVIGTVSPAPGPSTNADAMYVRIQAWLEGDTVHDNNSDVLDYWERVREDGTFDVVLGPTNSWSGGAADGRVQAGHFIVNEVSGLLELRVEAQTTFNVEA